MDNIIGGKVFTIILWLLMFSYFYNLPVFSYSIKGENELRLYDILGVFLFFNFFRYFTIISSEIKRIIFLRRFFYFVIYCSFAILLTLSFAIYKDRLIYFLQSFLYLYHLWLFFLGAVFLYLNLRSSRQYKNFITFLSILILLESILVLLQNLNIIPFLWSSTYAQAYGGFLSGTLGPNKIVIGMVMLISFIFLIAVANEKGIKIFRPLLYSALGGSLLCILLSGSRTTYLGLIIFLSYFLFKRTGNFIKFGIIAALFFVAVIFFSPAIIERISQTMENRVAYVINGPEDIRTQEDFTGIYEELGTGRDKLHLHYVNYLINNPLVIPFGKGFNNRMGVGNSAHNIYLSLINEVGIFGLVLFLRWLLSYIIIVKRKLPSMQMALNGMIISMMVTLYFGEHLYVYRPLFGVLGFFLMVSVLLLIPHKSKT